MEEKIREESRKLIESIYADEVRQFLEKMATVVDGKGNRLVVRNGYHKSRIVQTACGNVEVKLPRVDGQQNSAAVCQKDTDGRNIDSSPVPGGSLLEQISGGTVKRVWRWMERKPAFW